MRLFQKFLVFQTGSRIQLRQEDRDAEQDQREQSGSLAHHAGSVHLFLSGTVPVDEGQNHHVRAVQHMQNFMIPENPSSIFLFLLNLLNDSILNYCSMS